MWCGGRRRTVAAILYDGERLLQFSMTAAMAADFLKLIRSTSSTFLSAAFNYVSTGGDNEGMMEVAGGGAVEVPDCCGCCGLTLGRQLGGCDMVKYCSENCPSFHFNSEHEIECAHTKSSYALRGGRVPLLSAVGSSETPELSNEILFPYERFVRFFNWEKPGYPPCGLKNCGNSCFANVVLQCLTYTRPLAAFFLEEGHKVECRMDTWCFLCAFQNHTERVRWSHSSFIPTTILSQLHNIGGNLEHGKEEDAHEFMRFAIDKMQSVFLNEFGGDMAAHPRYPEMSLVQHIFGGCLQSQVICSKCNNVSIQFEHMMDLTVEINGDAESLEECLDQFTAEEWLHGDNMYKCDCCSSYVMARKRLGIQQAPNILTIALKRFQSGRFNQLNKRVTFPEVLDLRSYMNELDDGNDVYKLYAVIVHVGMLSASFCGHYICYVKDFGGHWYRVDDDKVSAVGLNEVLSQGAYMLLYSRICARPSCLIPAALLKEQENKKLKIQTVDLSMIQPVDTSLMPPTKCSEVEANCGAEFVRSAEDAGGDVQMASWDACQPTVSMESRNGDDFYNSLKEETFHLKLDHHKASAGWDVEDVRQYWRRDTNEGSLRRHHQDSGADMSCTFEKDRRYGTSSFTTREVQKENSASCTYMHGNAEREGNQSVPPDYGPIDAKLNRILASGSIGRGLENRASEIYSSVILDDCSEDAAAAGNTPIGLSSEVKLRPLSALGVKRRRQLFTQQSGVSVAPGGTAPRMYLNGFLSENCRSSKYD